MCAVCPSLITWNQWGLILLFSESRRCVQAPVWQILKLNRPSCAAWWSLSGLQNSQADDVHFCRMLRQWDLCRLYLIESCPILFFFSRRKSSSFTLGMSPVSWTVLVVTSVGYGASFRFVNLHLYSLMWKLEVDCTGNNIFSPLDFFPICIIQSAFSMTAHALFWQGHLGVLRS